jgi:large subunit ribosomal protein L15
MRLNSISDNQGARKRRKIVGRGHSTGHGKTSSRGGKGQTARAGGSVRPGFEGGQNPLYRRLPVRGFSNFAFDVNYATINLSELQYFVETGRIDAKKPVTIDSLMAAGIIKRRENGLKVLGGGELKSGLTIEAVAASASAAEKVKKAGGSITLLGGEAAQPAKKAKAAAPKAEAKAETTEKPVKEAKAKAAKPAATKKADAEKPAAKASKSTKSKA